MFSNLTLPFMHSHSNYAGAKHGTAPCPSPSTPHEIRSRTGTFLCFVISDCWTSFCHQTLSVWMHVDMTLIFTLKRVSESILLCFLAYYSNIAGTGTKVSIGFHSLWEYSSYSESGGHRNGFHVFWLFGVTSGRFTHLSTAPLLFSENNRLLRFNLHDNAKTVKINCS